MIYQTGLSMVFNIKDDRLIGLHGITLTYVSNIRSEFIWGSTIEVIEEIVARNIAGLGGDFNQLKVKFYADDGFCLCFSSFVGKVNDNKS